MTEFNLSEKMQEIKLRDKTENIKGHFGQNEFWKEMFMIEDVKEFIQIEYVILLMLINKTISVKRFWELRDKLAGDKFTVDTTSSN